MYCKTGAMHLIEFFPFDQQQEVFIYQPVHGEFSMCRCQDGTEIRRSDFQDFFLDSYHLDEKREMIEILGWI